MQTPCLLILSAVLSGAAHAATPPGFPLIPRECPEGISDGLRSALGDLRLECAAKAQVYGAHPQLNSQRIKAMGVDAAGQVRALVTDDDPAQAALYSGVISDAGTDGGMIWWGTWGSG